MLQDAKTLQKLCVLFLTFPFQLWGAEASRSLAQSQSGLRQPAYRSRFNHAFAETSTIGPQGLAH